MALDLLRLPRLFGTAPPPFRLVGRARGCCARPSAGDWQDWAELREASRAFLTPWEPTWSDDALSRAAFRRRLARYALDWHTDQGYTFLLFRVEDEALAGRHQPHQCAPRRRRDGSLGYWIGERYARQGYMTEGLRRSCSNSPSSGSRLHRVEAACLPHNVPSRALLAQIGLPRGRLCPRISLHRRQVAGPRAVRHACERMAKAQHLAAPDVRSDRVQA